MYFGQQLGFSFGNIFSKSVAHFCHSLGNVSQNNFHSSEFQLSFIDGSSGTISTVTTPKVGYDSLLPSGILTVLYLTLESRFILEDNVCERYEFCVFKKRLFILERQI